MTGLLEASANDVQLNIEITGTYDFIFSKAKYSRSIDGRSVELNDRGRIQLRGARHPLMLKTMVPLQLDMGTGYRSLIITGPNTGGKTVALKTLGLLTLMVQSGVLVPVDEGSMFCMFTKVLTAIGDGQSIEQSLSTFSAQIRRLIGMVDAADHSTLLLIDELAAGTDPGEGMSLSIAILEELNRKGAMMLVTTHFNELKSFAARTDGFQNARMEFDVETLEPLYRLTIGEAGQSYAIEIAKKLGMLPRIVSRSQEILLDHKPLMRSAEEAGNQGTIDGNCGVERRNAERVQQTTNSKPLGLASELDPSSKYPQEIPAMIFKNRPKDSETSITVRKFEIGDAVYVSSYGRNGIVFELEDSMGMVGVMIQKQKIRVNKKRLQLFIVKDELYPEDYDFDIIFETKEDRKKSKMMNRKHVEGLSIIHKPSEE
ncbi:recombination inhibitory protein MutS2 [Paenibacillus pini JCM 16418]|uniref:Recombination inhibitory protein MutS2 n=1 Tax=Paenibacillus pini JCM 16418 TaxID=1236976 RepID=W7YMD3_9BACL|nr:hypothetical protein [Paenibacillus pini]GAF09592.1 recombination inhibitory protein MutS2 [Paenibacillus pini JCM 16418]